MSFAVIIHEKGGQPRRQEFEKNEVTIGRVQGNDIILPKQNVSKRHSRIVVKDGKFIIVDLKSTNGTYVNGRKIASPMVIKETDKIYIGDFILSAEPLDGASKVDGPTEAKVKAPPPPPRRQPPASAKPRSPATSAGAGGLPGARRPRTARSSAAVRSAPPPAVEQAPAEQNAPPTAVPQEATPSAPPAPKPAPPEMPALVANAETAPRALYHWLTRYAANHQLTLPDQYTPDGEIDAALQKTLHDAAIAALDGMSGIDPEAVAERAVAEVIAAGPLADLLDDASLERIFFNGPDIVLVTRGGETTEHGAKFSCAAAMSSCARRLLRGHGVAVEDGQAFADAQFERGRRMHVAFGHVGGPFITIERIESPELNLDALVQQEVLSDEMATYLSHAMALGRVVVVASNDVDARLEFISALVGAVDDQLRIVAIESGARLGLTNPHAVLLSGNAPRSELLRNALKMCPDRLVLADAQGGETLAAMTAMGSAVNGGIVGVDAESPDDALVRLARQSSLSSGTQSAEVEAMLNDRADVLVQLLTFADGRRRVTQVMDIDDEMQEVFGGFQTFQGHGFVPRWYENARSLGHELSTDIFG
ncbi:MAG: ATPase, T2SS/T4P/T4SS family [Myxococcota bacterium]|nr:ATPase, T2SS/T4P/T4SS family [Myxococcota bacterium]